MASRTFSPRARVCVERAFGSAVRRDHHRLRGHLFGLLLDHHPLGLQCGQNVFVMDQVAENRQRLAARGFNASAMASLTPKHIPRCSARMIFIFCTYYTFTLYHKVKDLAVSVLFKGFKLFI